MKRLAFMIGILLACWPALAGCAGPAPASSAGKTVHLTLGAYTTPREAYKELIPLFQKQWKVKTGQEVTFDESYLGSGAQSRAIVEGFEADLAALSLEADITRIEKAGLITHDWQAGAHKGIVSTSVVAFAVRAGNPKGIHDWADLARPGIKVLTPNPKTSGGAMWNILALVGAAKRGYVEGVKANDDAAAEAFLLAVLQNVVAMDQGARESITSFEKGVGDVAITYENEVLVARQKGQSEELVFPRSSILIENPAALVDQYADKHGTREAAQAFLDFLWSRPAQEVFASYGLRSVDESVASATVGQYPKLADMFRIDFFSGWVKASLDFFGEEGVYTRTIAKVQGGGQ